MKKDLDKTPYELWYGYKPNDSYLKVFQGKCYILKEYRKRKFDVKGDKCLNFSTHKIIESAHVRIDEFAEKVKEESKKELEEYKRFVYYEFDTLPGIFDNKETSSAEPIVVTKLQVGYTKS